MQDAMALIREKRPEASPIPAFLSQLTAYEEKCIKLGVISKDGKRKMEIAEEKKSARRRIGPQMGPDMKRVIGPSLPLERKKNQQGNKKQIQVI